MYRWDERPRRYASYEPSSEMLSAFQVVACCVFSYWTTERQLVILALSTLNSWKNQFIHIFVPIRIPKLGREKIRFQFSFYDAFKGNCVNFTVSRMNTVHRTPSCFIFIAVIGAGVTGKLLLLGNCHQLSAPTMPTHHDFSSNLFTRISDKHRWQWR